jgi:hypothetical protein
MIDSAIEEELEDIEDAKKQIILADRLIAGEITLADVPGRSLPPKRITDIAGGIDQYSSWREQLIQDIRTREGAIAKEKVARELSGRNIFKI